MLVALRIRDLAVIEELEIEFPEGFTVLTGETGAGKSILVDALTLVLGGRASSDYIRTGSEEARVEALFDLSDSPAASALIKDRDLAGEDENAELLVRRVISRQGKNRVWINGKLETTSTLFEVGRKLVDIYGQHEYQSLMRQDEHRELLDSFGGLSEKLSQYKEAYDKWRTAEAKRAEVELDEVGKREREDLLKYRINEIESANLSAGEEEELRDERELLRNAETLSGAATEGVDILYESDDSVVGSLQKLSGRLSDAAGHDKRLTVMADQVEQASAILESASLDLRSYADGIEADPGRLEWIDDRLDEIKRLKKKYGDSVDEVLSAISAAKEELDNLERSEELQKELEEKAKMAREEAEKKAHDLSKLRKKTGKSLAESIERELSDLGMKKTRFKVRVEGPPDKGPGLTAEGADAVSFLISPNPGEDLKLLAKIASGGELSRIMLAIRVILSGEGDASTLVFDEVDQGVGGAVSDAVGNKMKGLSGRGQVLCVTHLPGIAALADSHVLVSKHQEKDRTWTEVNTLDHEHRVEEVARMISGKELTDTGRAHARELIEKGTAPKKAKKTKSAG